MFCAHTNSLYYIQWTIKNLLNRVLQCLGYSKGIAGEKSDIKSVDWIRLVSSYETERILIDMV